MPLIPISCPQVIKMNPRVMSCCCYTWIRTESTTTSENLIHAFPRSIQTPRLRNMDIAERRMRNDHEIQKHRRRRRKAKKFDNWGNLSLTLYEGKGDSSSPAARLATAHARSLQFILRTWFCHLWIFLEEKQKLEREIVEADEIWELRFELLSGKVKRVLEMFQNWRNASLRVYFRTRPESSRECQV